MSTPRLDEVDRIQIEQAGKGCVSGTLAEWPLLNEALRAKGIILDWDTPALALKAICSGLVEIERLRAELAKAKDAADSRICSSCLERHPIDVMCPPHEVRTTGQEWFRKRLREKDNENSILANRADWLVEKAKQLRSNLQAATRRLEIAEEVIHYAIGWCKDSEYGVVCHLEDRLQEALDEMERVK